MPSSAESFFNDTPVSDLPPTLCEVLLYCERAMAAVHPYILGLMPKRHARIIESKPDMLWPMTMLSAQSMVRKFLRMASSPNSTYV